MLAAGNIGHPCQGTSGMQGLQRGKDTVTCRNGRRHQHTDTARWFAMRPLQTGDIVDGGKDGIDHAKRDGCVGIARINAEDGAGHRGFSGCRTDGPPHETCADDDQSVEGGLRQ
jgi:hypothetical protein